MRLFERFEHRGQGGNTQPLAYRYAYIIQRHLQSRREFNHNGDFTSTYVMRCMDEIKKTSKAEGRYVRAEFNALSESVTQQFRELQAEFDKRQIEKNTRELREKCATLKDKHAELIDKFYAIADRKVTRDDYGDVRWDALYREIGRAIQKIAHIEGFETEQARQAVNVWECREIYGARIAVGWDNRTVWEMAEKDIPDSELLKDQLAPALEYRQLVRFLAQSFKERRANKRGHTSFDSMTGPDFESYFMNVLKRLGYTSVYGTPATGDQGADITAKSKDGKLIVIQAKRYAGPVGNAAVQQVLAAVHFYAGDEGWVVTNSTFTPAAKELAQRTGIRLIDGHQLARLSGSKPS